MFDFCSFGVRLDLVPGERSDPARRIGIEVTYLDIEDFHGTESLGAWIEEQNSYEVSVTLAARAALRVQPWLWVELAPVRSDVGVTALHSFCSMCASAVAARALNPALRKALNSASIGLMAAEEAAETVLVDLPNHVASPAFLAADAARAAAAASLHRGPAVDAVVGAVDAYLAMKPTANIVTRSGASFEEVLRDARMMSADPGAAWDLPLWQTHVDRFSSVWLKTRDTWESAGAPWDSFVEIYQGFLHGQKPDWDYLERIVLIYPEIWDAGPEAVAEAIRIIDEQQRLAVLAKEQLEKLRRFRGSRRSSGSPGLGHNNPPESLSDEASRAVLEAGAIAGQALEELTEELAKTDPSNERLDDSSNRLLKALSIVAKYCGQKLDLAVDTLIKWGIPAGGVWLAANYTELSALANGAKALAKMLGG